MTDVDPSAVPEPPAPGNLLAATLSVETPERVRIVYDVAGIGSRFAAGSIDFSILVLVWTVVSITAAVMDVGPLARTGADHAALAFALGGLFVAFMWLYYLGFEIFWGGRTPGKWAFKLRVVSRSGGRAGVLSMVARNLVRIVDTLPIPGMYVLGGIVMFLNRNSMRIGDYIAGTIVVRERPLDLSLDTVKAAAGVVTEGLATDGRAGAGGSGLSEEERAFVLLFVRRRKELMSGPRAALADDLVARLKTRHDLPLIDPEKLLRLLGQGHTPGELVNLAGPSSGGGTG